MLLKYVEFAAAAIAALLGLLVGLISFRYRREILAAERQKASQKLRARDAMRDGTQIGMKEPESDQHLVGAK